MVQDPSRRSTPCLQHFLNGHVFSNTRNLFLRYDNLDFRTTRLQSLQHRRFGFRKHDIGDKGSLPILPIANERDIIPVWIPEFKRRLHGKTVVGQPEIATCNQGPEHGLDIVISTEQIRPDQHQARCIAHCPAPCGTPQYRRDKEHRQSGPCSATEQVFNPTFHVRNESPRFARAFVRFLELSNKGLHYTPADAVCAASELTFGGGCAGSVSPSWFKRILTSSFGST